MYERHQWIHSVAVKIVVQHTVDSYNEHKIINDSDKPAIFTDYNQLYGDLHTVDTDIQHVNDDDLVIESLLYCCLATNILTDLLI